MLDLRQAIGLAARELHFLIPTDGTLNRLVENFMPLQPLHDRVIVKRKEAETKTSGGILLPDTAKNKPQKGEVIAVGPGKTRKDGKVQPLQVKVGDSVLFTIWAGEEYKDRVSTDEIVIMREEDILAVLD